jgi:anaerobic selenocysteine-containing dehydrogenase
MANEGSLLADMTTEDPSRRTFIKWSAVAGGSAAAVGVGWKLGLIPIGSDGVAAATAAATPGRYVWSSCNVNCGSRCPLRMYVVDGQIVRVDPDNTGTDVVGSQRIPACPRGRSIRQRIYNPDRLKYPMKRVGKRGEGEFTRISWDEAFDTIAASLKHTIHTYGNQAVYINYGTGTIGGTITSSWPGGGTLIARLMNNVGGFMDQYGDYSAAQI